VLSTVHLNANERLISDFIGTQSVAIPDAHLINENNIITEITGKLGGNTMDNGESILDFTVIRLGANSFLAQAIVGTHKKGVFLITMGCVVTKPGIKRSLASKWVVDKIKLTMPYPSAVCSLAL
jgi:hypothetical protein